MKKINSIGLLLLLLLIPQSSNAQIVIEPTSSGGGGASFPLSCTGDGSAAAPCYTGSTANSGIYFSTTSTLISANGINVATFAATSFSSAQPILGPNGAVGTPTYSFTGETNTGFYRSGAGAILTAIQGVLGFEIGGGYAQIRHDTVPTLYLGNAGNLSTIQGTGVAGVITLTNAAGSFNRLQLGGTTSSFPAIKRESAVLAAKLADDSDYASFFAGSVRMNAAGYLFWLGRSNIRSSSNGLIEFTDAAESSTVRISNLNGGNGQVFGLVNTLSELTTIAAAATTDTTIQMPANSVVLAVSVRVTTVIPTAATFTVGDSGSAARFSTAAVSTAATSTDPGTKAGAYYNASALSIRITPDLTPADNTGRVRVTIYYYTVTPPTS